MESSYQGENRSTSTLYCAHTTHTHTHTLTHIHTHTHTRLTWRAAPKQPLRGYIVATAQLNVRTCADAVAGGAVEVDAVAGIVAAAAAAAHGDGALRVVGPPAPRLAALDLYRVFCAV